MRVGNEIVPGGIMVPTTYVKTPAVLVTPERQSPEGFVPMHSDDTSSASPAKSISDTTENSIELGEPHPVNYYLLPPDEWIEPPFADILHELDSFCSDLEEKFETAIRDAFLTAQQDENWDGGAGIGMMTWVYFRWSHVRTDLIAELFSKMSIKEHINLRRAIEQRTSDMSEVHYVNHLKALPYPEYLTTPHWHQIREDALERASHRCQLCNETKRLHVHHRSYANRGRETPDDVIVLCAGCHKHFHDKLRVKK